MSTWNDQTVQPRRFKMNILRYLVLAPVLLASPARAQTGLPISALPAASTLTGSEIVPVVQGGVTKRTTASAIQQGPSQSANTVFAAPNGSAGVPTFRALLPADLGSQTANTFVAAPNGITGLPTFRAMVTGDVPTGTSGAAIPLLSGANTWAAKQTFPAPTTANASINLPQGTAPTLPNNGDLWTTPSGVFARINGSTVGPLSSGTGSVTSVSGAGSVSGLSLTGTVTSAGNLTLGGTLAVTPSNFASQTANSFLAAPNGSAGAPTFRALVGQDISGITGLVYTPSVTVASAGAAGANVTAIAASMAAANTAGGGVVQLPCGVIYVNAPIDNIYSRVLVRGCGRDYLHDAGTPTYGTQIYPTVSGNVLIHETPSGVGNAKNSGGGFQYITVNGNGFGLDLLRVISVNEGIYDLNLIDSVGTEAAYFGTLVTGTTLAEAADVQHAHINLSIRQLDGTAAQAADGAVFDGSSNANFSMNNDVHIAVQIYNGNGVVCKNADNNNFADIGVIKVGSGRTFLGYGSNSGTGSVGCGSNMLSHISGTGPIYFRGTSDGDTAGVQNEIEYLDTGNGTPFPTFGAGSSGTYYDAMRGNITNLGQIASYISDGAVASVNQRGWKSATETLDILNGSSDHIRLRDGTNANVWGLNLSGPNIRFLELAGSGGQFQIPGSSFSGSTAYLPFVRVGGNQHQIFDNGANNLTIGLANATTVTQYLSFDLNGSNQPMIDSISAHVGFASNGTEKAYVDVNGFTSQSIAGTGAATFSPGAAAGAGATMVCTTSRLCDNISGSFTLTTGTGPGTGTLGTITLPSTRATAPDCVVTIRSTTGAQVSDSETVSAITVTALSALSVSTAYFGTYICGGK